jgi:hypothetical protein
MSTIIEIEKAIEQLSPSQVEELAAWLETYRQKQTHPSHVENWLAQARGAARPGETTANIMTLTRGEE